MSTHADAGCRALVDDRPDDYPHLIVARYLPLGGGDGPGGTRWPAVCLEGYEVVEPETKRIKARLRRYFRTEVWGERATVLAAVLFEGNQPVRYHWARIEGGHVHVGPTAPFQGWSLEPWEGRP